MNQQALSAFIWSVADLLRGDYKQSDYGKVICDHCGTQARHDEGDGLNSFLQLGFDAGWGSSLGDGTRVDIDLCHSCLKETLGPWLRLSKPAWALVPEG